MLLSRSYIWQLGFFFPRRLSSSSCSTIRHAGESHPLRHDNGRDQPLLRRHITAGEVASLHVVNKWTILQRQQIAIRLNARAAFSRWTSIGSRSSTVSHCSQRRVITAYPLTMCGVTGLPFTARRLRPLPKAASLCLALPQKSHSAGMLQRLRLMKTPRFILLSKICENARYSSVKVQESTGACY
jgi:hypothetical protein